MGHEPVKNHRFDTPLDFVQDNVVLHQTKHLELVGDIHRLLDNTSLGYSQSD